MDHQGLFETITDSAVLLDKAGRIINWNSGASSLFGYAKREVLGRSINTIYDRNYPFPKLIQEILTHQKKWQEDTIFIRKNGIKGHCKSHLCPLQPNEQNKAIALLIHQNISTYKKAEDELHKLRNTILDQLQLSLKGFWNASTLLVETLNNLDQTEKKLRESELRFHLLAENATDIISRHTPDGTYLYVSPASKSAIGYNPDDLIGKNIYKLIHHDDQPKVRKAFTRRREDAHNKPIIYRLKKKEGEFRWFESTIRLIIDEPSRIISEIQLSSRDITDRVLDKKARLRGQQLAHVFRLSTMEEMASGMAHEISQPLAAIVNYTRGCVRHLENGTHDRDQLRHVMEKAVAQAERAGEIVHRLKNFFCKGQLVKTSCKINNVIRETVSFIKSELSSSKTKIDFEFDKDIPYIFIDKIQIQQVLLNLIQNAIEAMQQSHTKEKRIYIQTKQANPEMIEITIMDTGPGFPKEIMHKAFMPFFTTKAHGRGMGLAICRSIIEAHGGQFMINPNTTSSSWIRFSLPISI
ncbi:PAS domain-containing sensor histidine kinase [Aquicella lusitana]|uniref:histidine kinase n=1 Tax=Aquicella lusitana TaxID=254246 RepID=A0A370G7R5_9COXI|nr:PAS domain S-box protein [Aquicella lusitana]RDI39835.1 PAS domain S-box-containing protein [Aquicella lusitana]VVC73144.1 Sensor protein FixL [Aquicella lusitana]